MKADGQCAYERYNAGGDPATANLNYKGEPCPEWDALPENVQAKWHASAAPPRCSLGFAIYSPLARSLNLRNGGLVSVLRGEIGDDANAPFTDGVTIQISGPGVFEMDEVLALHDLMTDGAELDAVSLRTASVEVIRMVPAGRKG